MRKYYRADALEDVVVRGLEGAPSVLDRQALPGRTVPERFAAGSPAPTCSSRRSADAATRATNARSADMSPPCAPAAPRRRHRRHRPRRPATSPAGASRTPTGSTAPAAALDAICTRSPALTALRGHVTGFAEMLTGRHGERLDARLAGVETDDLPGLHRFANGLRRDHVAVLAGLTLPHSSGVVEAPTASR
ncbi:hypothetical protein [Pseudofrankia sp. DC12]|uniref:hypothetical protein n=1 Tax=Pseudofrankia sp. DC12 TaxID=683315 RepID=UPI001E44B525|nr:hypothetical protein [Pseudofrankia sp. DC12]